MHNYFPYFLLRRSIPTAFLNSLSSIKHAFIPTLEAIQERGCHTSEQSPGLRYLISFAFSAEGPYETGS